MIINNVGSRGAIFTFSAREYPAAGDISLYLITGNNKIFLCDSHLGPDSMEYIKQYTAGISHKELILFNSHSDWDHIWGNCAFPGSTIIAHKACRERMLERGQFDLERFQRYHNGSIVLKLPNLTFDSKIVFEDDDLEFIYAPGHTADSAICYDRKDSVLFAGDLIEYPIPYLSYSDLEAYMKTLEYLKTFKAKTIICSHSGIVDSRLIDANLAYIESIYSVKTVEVKDSEDFINVHDYNIKNLLLLRYENIARKKSGNAFNFVAFRSEFLNLGNMTYENLEEALKSYVEKL